MTDVTRQLARFVVASRWTELPREVRHEAKRALLNWLGCALGGCNDPAVDTALAGLREFAGPPQATVLGRRERLDILNAALVNAIGSNVLDFDDTHLRTVIHPTVPVAAAITALAEHVPVTGAQFLHAFVLGVEAECRIGLAVSPEHYNAGWHITSTCGVFGAAAACGKLLKLDEQQMTWALGIAATQAAGLTAVHGSMSKCFNMGHAARNGLTAALLAQKGFTSSERGIEAPRGFAHVLSPRCDLNAIVDGLGHRWELLENAYKPYPCGIVGHPIIDGCLELRSAHGIAPDAIERIELRVHPLVMELMGNPAPRTGLEAQAVGASLRRRRVRFRRSRRQGVHRCLRDRSRGRRPARPCRADDRHRDGSGRCRRRQSRSRMAKNIMRSCRMRWAAWSARSPTPSSKTNSARSRRGDFRRAMPTT